MLDHARQGDLALIAVTTLVNGVAGELFFRGALYAAIGVRHPVAISTVVYTLTIVATGHAMLVFAAAMLGVLVGRQRRISGGVLAPMLTRVTWSAGMLLALPPIMAPGREPGGRRTASTRGGVGPLTLLASPLSTSSTEESS